MGISDSVSQGPGGHRLDGRAGLLCRLGLSWTWIACAAAWGAGIAGTADARDPAWVGRTGLALAITLTVVAVLRPRKAARTVIVHEHSGRLAARLAETEAHVAENDARIGAIFDTMRQAAELTGASLEDEPRLRLVSGGRTG
jgi:multidrug efflux pump subunit AcrA (membrane-fusion protein)